MGSLTASAPKFAQLASALAQRAAETLGAAVLIADQRGQVIAGSQADLARLSVDDMVQSGDDGFLRIPLRVDGQVGEVLVGPPANGEALSPRLTQVLLELLIDQAMVVERLPNQHELKSSFIYDLLNGKITDEDTLLRHAHFLGLDLTPPRAVILIDAKDYIVGNADELRVQRHAQMVIKSVVSFFHLPNDTICAYIGNGEVAVLKASNTKNLAIWADDQAVPLDGNASWANLTALKRAGDALLARLRRDTGASVSIGIGRYHPGVEGLALSYQDAKAALSLGRRFHGQNQVHCLDGLGIAAFVGVSDEQTKLDLALHLLSPLDHEPDMIETLTAFFAENCSPSATAKRLSIHRNTLSYRLDKIASLTGLDPRQFDNAVQVRLALVLRSLSTQNTGEVAPQT
jgi:carbohydrate diacid regulator